MKKSITFKGLFFFVLIVIIGGLLSAYLPTSPSSGSRKIKTTVSRSTIIQRVTIAGNVIPARKSLITAPYNGYVKKLFVKLGQKVKKNYPLVSITQSLQSNDSVYPLRSPFNGTVVSLSKQEGELVQENSTTNYILRIDDLSTLYIYSAAPEIDMIKMKIGQEVMIKASAILDTKFTGVIESMALAAKDQEDWRGNSKVEYDVKIKVNKPYHNLSPGMSAIIDIITAKKKDVLTLPHEFIIQEDGKYYVLRDNDNKTEVKIGMQNESLFEITDGLNEGDVVYQVDILKLLEKK